VSTLRSLLEWSLGTSSELLAGSLAEAAAQIRAEREQFGCSSIPPIAEPEVDPSRIRLRRGKDVLAAAEEALVASEPVG
jgi:hypothetical protein